MKFLLAITVAAIALAPFDLFAEPSQVFVVRHAERAQEPKEDPAISPEGISRAQSLAHVLSASELTTIFTSQYRRTQETAAPTAKQFAITPTVISIKSANIDAHIQELVKEIRKAKGAVLVVGHSNTVAGIVAALSSSKPMQLCETSFSNLFLVIPQSPSLPAVQLKYGAADAPPKVGCL